MVGNEGSRLRVEKSTVEIDEFVSERVEMRGKALDARRILFPSSRIKKKRTCCTAVKKPGVIKRASNYTPLASTASILRFSARASPTFSVKIGERERKRERRAKDETSNYDSCSVCENLSHA